MASLLMMAGGAILNAATFTGGNYLTKDLSGDSGKVALVERKSGMTKLSQIIRLCEPNTSGTAPSCLTGLKPIA